MIISDLVPSLLFPIPSDADAKQPSDSVGKECLPKRRWRRRLLSPKIADVPLQKLPRGADVGILGECPPDQACEADATSSLGGRCVAAASSARRMDEQLALCHYTCPDPIACEFYYGSPLDLDDEAIASIALTCKNGDYEKCFPNYLVFFKAYICPLYECLDDGQDYNDCSCQAYEDYYNFCIAHCPESKDDANNTDCYSCGEVIEAFDDLSWRYYIDRRCHQQNKMNKRMQLIEGRYHECVNNQSEFQQEMTASAAYAILQCACQKNDELCEFYLEIYGGEYEEQELRTHCQVSNCCNRTESIDDLAACIYRYGYNGILTEQIQSRFDECVYRVNNSSEFQQEMTAEETSAIDHGCLCQAHDNLCKINLEIYGGVYEEQEYCQIVNCCNRTESIDDLATCIDQILFDGHESYPSHAANLTAPNKTEIPSSSTPSTMPSASESREDNPAPGGNGTSQSNAASNDSSDIFLASVLFATTIGFFVQENAWLW